MTNEIQDSIGLSAGKLGVKACNNARSYVTQSPRTVQDMHRDTCTVNTEQSKTTLVTALQHAEASWQIPGPWSVTTHRSTRLNASNPALEVRSTTRRIRGMPIALRR